MSRVDLFWRFKVCLERQARGDRRQRRASHLDSDIARSPRTPLRAYVRSSLSPASSYARHQRLLYSWMYYTYMHHVRRLERADAMAEMTFSTLDELRQSICCSMVTYALSGQRTPEYHAPGVTSTVHHDQESTSSKDRSFVFSRHAARPDLRNGNRETECDKQIPIHTYACVQEVSTAVRNV